MSQDVSALSTSVSGAELLVVDPSGRRTGFDADIMADVKQIPGSVYFREGMSDDLTGAPAPQLDALVHIPQPAAGVYRLLVTGREPGPFTVMVCGFSRDGTPQPVLMLPGVAQVGVSTALQLQFDPSGVVSDTAPPTTTAVLSPVPNALGWNTSDVIVNLNATDTP